MKKTIALLIFLIALNFVTLTSLHAKDESVCLKNGREFYITLANYLGLSGNLRNYKEKFVELANNLPKQGHMSEFAPSLASLVQLTDKICVDYANNTAAPTEDLSMRFRKGDSKIIADFINKEVLEGNIKVSSIYFEERDQIRIIQNAYTSPTRVYVNCLQYLSHIRENNKPNFKNEYVKYKYRDWERYCDIAAPKIAIIFKERAQKEQALHEQKTMAMRLTKFRNLINGTYIKILNRAANATEIESFNSMAITDENQMVYISCVSAAASLEFIRNDRPCD